MLKYFQSLDKQEQLSINEKINEIPYFFKEDLSKRKFSNLNEIRKELHKKHEFMVVINNIGFISGVYENKRLHSITIVNFEKNNFKFMKGVLYFLGILETLPIEKVEFAVFEDLDIVLDMDKRLCDKFKLKLIKKHNEDGFIKFKYERRKNDI